MRNQKMFDMLKNAVDKAKNGTPNKDGGGDKENYWKLEGDKAGNGSAILRFLPGKDDDSIPFIKIFNHGFKSKDGKWFIENCPTTLGNPCYCCERNSELWQTKVESNIEIARERKRKTKYVSNVLVVQDAKNPDNEGKVFKFQYGQKIFDKINEAINPEFEDADTPPMNPFDPVEGANFKLKMIKLGGYSNFDKSGWSSASAIGDSKEIVDVISKLFDIESLVAPDQFKSYEEIEKRFKFIVDGDQRVSKQPTVDDDSDDDAAYVKQAVRATKPVKESVQAPKTLATEDDDDMMSEFQRLADED